MTLDAALDFLREHSLGVHLDIKQPGYEEAVVETLRRHKMEDHGLVSTTFSVSFARRLAVLAPALTRAIGYPTRPVRVARFRWPGWLTRLGAAALRQVRPRGVPLLIRAARDALSLHHSLCSPAAVRAAHALDAPVLAWTANDPSAVRRLAAAGVDAIVSDDPGMALRTLATLREQ